MPLETIFFKTHKMERTKVIDLLKREDYGALVNVKGWVRTRRGSKAVNFVALNDGSTIKNVQIVVDVDKFDENTIKDITTGACINVEGTLVKSQGAEQSVEIQASSTAPFLCFCWEVPFSGMCGQGSDCSASPKWTGTPACEVLPFSESIPGRDFSRC